MDTKMSKNCEFETLNQYFIPDLTNFILEYCWTKEGGFSTNCFYGNYEEALKVINKEVNLTYGIHGSAHNGPQDMLEMLFNLGIDNNSMDWNLGLYGACWAGHIKIVKLMIEKSKIEKSPLFYMDWNTGLHGSCKGGHMEIVKLIIKNAQKIIKIDVGRGIRVAHNKERTAIYKLLMPLLYKQGYTSTFVPI